MVPEVFKVYQNRSKDPVYQEWKFSKMCNTNALILWIKDFSINEKFLLKFSKNIRPKECTCPNTVDLNFLLIETKTQRFSKFLFILHKR